jgi:hypothetical protein
MGVSQAESTVQETIRIYRVLNTPSLTSARDRLAAIFAGRPEDTSVTFGISQDAARIWFSDSRILWQTDDPAMLPHDPRAAEIAARSFMDLVNRAVQRDRDLAAAGIERLFPDDCRPALNGVAKPQPDGSGSTQSVLVRDTVHGVADHWLVRFEIYLPTGTSAGSVPVFGARVEFRVGPGGAIGACDITWRPCIPQGMTPLISVRSPPSDSTSSIMSPTPGTSNDVPAVLGYLLADEGTMQPYLAPYYFVPEEDNGFYEPASAFSLIAEFADDSTADSARIAAAVNGGSGQYTYRWAAYDYADLAAGMADLGSEDRIALDPGCYNLVLRVTDTATGMVIYVERSIYTDMLVTPRESP